MTTLSSATSAEFSCRRCGECCRWPGCVKLRPGEAEEIAAFLGMTADDFYEHCTRLAPDRSCLSLNETGDGKCIFLDEGMDGDLPGCRIDAVKPRQCRDFPARWNFPGWEKLCAGAKKDREEI